MSFMRVALACALAIVVAGCVQQAPLRVKVVTVEKPGKRIDATDEQLRNALIGSSIDRYRLTKGNCPCPYSRFTRLGTEQRCGKQSAYCIEKGEYPLCF